MLADRRMTLAMAAVAASAASNESLSSENSVPSPTEDVTTSVANKVNSLTEEVITSGANKVTSDSADIFENSVSSTKVTETDSISKSTISSEVEDNKPSNIIKPTTTQDSDLEPVMYFAGCMSHLTPRIVNGVKKVFEKAGQPYVFLDEEGGICCGRPLMLAGKDKAAKEVIEANRRLIFYSSCKTLVLSCPICLKVFKEEYNLQGIEILHYTEYMDRLVQKGKLKLTKAEGSFVYHDPCELGRGCGIYDEPRRLVSGIGELKKASMERAESVCCGGSLGSLTLDYQDRGQITKGSLDVLLANKPDKIVTACPLCFKTFCDKSPVPVVDIADLVAENSEVADS